MCLYKVSKAAKMLPTDQEGMRKTGSPSRQEKCLQAWQKGAGPVDGGNTVYCLKTLSSHVDQNVGLPCSECSRSRVAMQVFKSSPTSIVFLNLI